MVEILRSIKSWYERKSREQRAYFWDNDTPLENLHKGLMYDDQDRIDYALEKLTYECKLTLADDQNALYELICKCAQFSSPTNLKLLISFWTGERKKLRNSYGTPIHSVLYNKSYSKAELWELLLKIFPIDIPRTGGVSALADAASLGNLEDIELLTQFGASPLANLKSYDVCYPLAFSLFFNDDRAAFLKLFELAANTRTERIELLNQVLFSVCEYPYHAGEYPGEKRISDMEYLVSVGASFDYLPDGREKEGLMSLEHGEFRRVLEPLLKVMKKSGYNLSENPRTLLDLIGKFWRDAPILIRLFYEDGVNFNSGYVTYSGALEPIWFGILDFSYSVPENWLSVAKELKRCQISLDLKDSHGRGFWDIRVLPGKTKLDKYSVLNHLRTLGLRYEIYTEAINALNTAYSDK